MSFTTRFNYTMTPNLSLQVYAEPFVSAGDYSNYKELVDGRAESYEDRYRPYAYAGNAELQHPLVPHDQRAALGIPARLDAVPGLAAGQVGRPGITAISASAGTSAACSRRPRTTSS